MIDCWKLLVVLSILDACCAESSKIRKSYLYHLKWNYNKDFLNVHLHGWHYVLITASVAVVCLAIGGGFGAWCTIRRLKKEDRLTCPCQNTCSRPETYKYSCYKKARQKKKPRVCLEDFESICLNKKKKERIKHHMEFHDRLLEYHHPTEHHKPIHEYGDIKSYDAIYAKK